MVNDVSMGQIALCRRVIRTRLFFQRFEVLNHLFILSGNDSIVAFSRLQSVTVVIHQLNEPLWQVHGSKDGSTPCDRELHISYHNGDHYNSVRRLGEDRNVRAPANIRVSLLKDRQAALGRAGQATNGVSRDVSPEELSDYENATEEDVMVQKIIKLTGEQKGLTEKSENPLKLN